MSGTSVLRQRKSRRSHEQFLFTRFFDSTSACDIQYGASAIGSLIGQQPENSLRDLFRSTSSLHDNCVSQRFKSFVASHTLVHVRIDKPGADRVDSYPVWCQFFCQSNGERINCPFGSSIVNVIVCRPQARCTGRDVDD